MVNNVPRLKHGRPIGSMNAVSRKIKGRNQKPTLLDSNQVVSREETTSKEVETYKKIIDLENIEIFINYYNNFWNQNEIIIDNLFAFLVAHEIIHDDYEPHFIIECHQMQDWSK